MDTIRVGDKVQFGRTHGEHTVGVVEKINARSVKVRQTEARGAHPVGTIWRVSPRLVWLAGGSPPCTGHVVPQVKRSEDEIMGDIMGCYNGLSPENLWCDGEASPSQARATERHLNAKLRECFRELGRTVNESEAWDWARTHRAW